MAPSFAAAPTIRPPLGDDVHVWRARLDLPEDDIACMAAELDPAERARAERMATAELRAAAIASAALLRRILCSYTGSQPGELRLVRDGDGKPHLESPAAPRFNLSHSAGLALVALHARLEVGVDVEQIAPARVDDELAQRILAPSERAPWAALSAEQRVPLFFTLWAHKEAAMKAVGLGLRLDPRELPLLQTKPDGSSELTRRCATPRGAVELMPLAAGPNFAAALGLVGEFGGVQTWEWERAAAR